MHQINEEKGPKQIDYEKTFFEKCKYMTYKGFVGFKLYLFNPFMGTIGRKLMNFFTFRQKKQSWWDVMIGNERSTFWDKFRVVKNTKSMIIRKLSVFFGGILFIYILAKSIPRNIKNYRLRKKEMALEEKRLEIQKMQLELESKRNKR